MPPKQSQFDKTKALLSLPEAEYPLAVQAVYNQLANNLTGNVKKSVTQVIAMIQKHNLNLKQVSGGISYLKDNEFKEVDFEKSCGIGVTYTDAEVSASLDAVVKANPTFPKHKILSTLSTAYPWADGKAIKDKVDKFFETYVAQVEVKEKVVKEVATAKETILQPLEVVYNPIPYENRYEQLPEQNKLHEAFLKDLGVNVITRFPPEPNGYLHLGHAKSMFINFGYAKFRGGKTYIRLDDTNPEKEDQEYIRAIIDMVKWLGWEPFKITHASDYFQRLYDIAEDLIKQGHMYIDNQTPDQVEEYRQKRLDPPCRSRSISENLRLFREMRMGMHSEGTLTARCKINMQDDNPNMRDFIAYRIKFCDHPVSGDQWCIYPSYDYTHCLNDAFENITHSICTMEFNIRRPSYDWLTHIVGGYRPMQWEFSRLNVTHMMMSKRRLLRMVQEKIVEGWRDPRMPTLVGLRRRGFTPSIINTFCQLCGVSRTDQTIEYSRLEQVARQEFENSTNRAMAVLEPLLIEFEDYEKDVEIEYPLHPLLKERGSVKIRFQKRIYVEKSEFFNGPADAKWAKLALDQPCALRYGPIIIPQRMEGDKLICKHVFGDEAVNKLKEELKSKKKELLRLHWIAQGDARAVKTNVYDVMFLSKSPAELEDWIADINPNSLVVVKAMVPNHVFKECQKGVVNGVYEVFQFERQGYFVVDETSVKGAEVLNRVTALKSNF